jgi:hypothetical protein
MAYDSLPPTLSIERLDSLKTNGIVYLDEEERGFSACRHAKEGDTLDYIALSYSPDGSKHGFAAIYLTPAMIVHMANTLLTDSERSAILAPALAGADTE